MIIFKLPDLGEGLADAKIREWHVKVGDVVKIDDVLVSVETAKAIVDVPAPFAGIIEKLFGKNDDVIETGNPLIGFEGEEGEKISSDKGTVVGNITQSNQILEEETTITSTAVKLNITPKALYLAKKLGIDFNDLQNLQTSEQLITPAIIEELVKKKKLVPREAASTTSTTDTTSRTTATSSPKAISNTAETPNVSAASALDTISTVDSASAEQGQPFDGMRRAMFNAMLNSHQQVAAVTNWDDADIHAWYKKDNVTIRLIRAIVKACEAQPLLNATFDSTNLQYQINLHVNLGLALNTEQGLYVPVIKDVANLSDQELRKKINQFKEQAKLRLLHQNDLHGATITLSNFGSIGARYATPIVVPPQVAIVGAGRIFHSPVATNADTISIHPLLPISLTFDHRLATGAESLQFMATLLHALRETSA